MRVGVAREAKAGERRVSLTPAGAGQLHRDGHEVLVESGIRVRTRTVFTYRIAGRVEVWRESELLCKVKEPAR
jgi:alanine dehydrogenase